MILDLFAGPGGWDEGLRLLGHTDVIGVEWDTDACATARAAGHERIQADVASLDPMRITGWESDCDGLIASPPCQSWSQSGDRKGAIDRDGCHELADNMAAGIDHIGPQWWSDERSALVCQPVRWVRELRPEWIALEEVPAVAPLWEHFATIFKGWGYNVWTGDLDAQDYGVPQRRIRRILMAHRSRPVGPPAATHQVPVTMADALGWGMTEKPYPTIACSRSTGGPDKEKVGGSGARKSIYAERDAGRWIDAPQSGQLDLDAMPADMSIRLSLPEAAVLQGFRPDYPWKGNASKRAQQIGNAVPPPLAAAIIGALGVAAVAERAA